LSLLGLPMLIQVESHADAWLSLDPMAELAGMVGKEKIIVATPETPVQEIIDKINQ
jgi:hypothetical protein